jgi:hypothetical protein
MAYDEDLADRIRELILGEPGLSEKKMFGGLAFLVGGNMPSPRVVKVERWSASILRSRTGWSPPPRPT